MGASNTANIEAKQAPQLQSCAPQSQLAGTPQNPPKFSATVKNSENQDVQLGDPTVSRALVALMDQHAVDGGAACHWGGGSAFAEIMSSVHGLMFADKSKDWHTAFNFVNDAGHTENGVYALRANLGFDNMTFDDLKGFRNITSKLAGHGEAHLNPEGVLTSNGPLGSGVPQAQGLCFADKLLGNQRVTICTVSDGASMEGEAKEAYAAIPGFATKGQMNPFVLVVSDNNAKLSGRIEADSFSMSPSLQAFPALGWDTTYLQEGHDLQKVYTTIESALAKAIANPNKPVCVVVKTIKGYGVKATEEDASGGHGYPLKKNDGKIIAFIDEIFKGNTPDLFKQWASDLAKPSEPKANASAPTVKKIKMQAGIPKAAIRATEEGYPVISISADLQGSTGIAGYHKAFPDRAIEVGVAESNMISMGVGASLAGLIPIVDTFAQFGVTKGNLPLIMAGLSHAPIIGLFSHTGFQDAADGASHQATTYLAAVSAIPQVTVVVCSCADECETYLYEAIKGINDQRKAGKHPDSVVLYIGRENFSQTLKEGLTYTWGKSQVLREGDDVTIVACGPMAHEALAAGQILEGRGVSATVINNPFINKPDLDTIGQAVQKTGGKLITVEDHQVVCGMGTQLSHALQTNGITISQLKSIGIQGKFGQSAYMADHLYQKHGLDATGIATAAQSLG